MFSKNDINTGRQVEFDYLKGLFIPMILLIHAFQMLGGAKVPAYRITYIIATMTGAAIFIFVLGFGSVYSRKDCKGLAMAGVRLIVMEFVWNALALTLPMILGQLLRMITGHEPLWALTWMQAPMMLQYINVFFIAGVCYLVLALLKFFDTPAVVYIGLAVLLFVVDPFLYMNGKTTGNGVLDYILTTFVGGRAAVSLNFIALLPHALLGVGFGKILRKTENKGRLYGILSIPLIIIVAVYFIHAFNTYPGLDALYNYSGMGYIYPDILRAFANAASVLLFAGSLYALRNIIGRCKLLHNALIHLNRNNTPYYAIHPFWYGIIFATAGYTSFSAKLCTVMAIVVWGLCFVTITVWNRCKKRNGTTL